MDQMAERARVELLNAGMIPEEQWTDEEKQKIAQQQAEAQNQPPQEDPALREARGIELSGEADVMNAQTKQQQAQFDAQVKGAQVQLEQDKIALEREKLQLDAAKFERAGQDKFNVEAAKIDQGQQKLDQSNQQMQIDATFKQQAAQQQEINDAINNLKVLREAMGVSAIVGPANTQAYKDQADIVLDEQKE